MRDPIVDISLVGDVYFGLALFLYTLFREQPESDPPRGFVTACHAMKLAPENMKQEPSFSIAFGYVAVLPPNACRCSIDR
jgi:hypothetical protein